MFKSHKFLIVTFLAGFGCLNAHVDAEGFTITELDPAFVKIVSTNIENAMSSVTLPDLSSVTLPSLSENGYGDYVLAANNPGYEKVSNTLKESYDVNVAGKISAASVVPAINAQQRYNVQKIALVSAGIVVATLIAYKMYQYVQSLNVDEQELIDSILSSASQESEVEAFQSIVSWTGIKVIHNADLILLTNDQIKSVLKQVAKIQSTDSKKLTIAMMLTRFDMNEKTRKNVVAKLKSL